MAKKDYTAARAGKKKSSLNLENDLSKSDTKKIAKTLKKSTLLLVCCLFLIVGLVGGYFAFSYLSAFEMNDYKVNGEISAEADYIEIDPSSIKEELEKDGKTISYDELFSSIKLEDLGVRCNIFGIDISNTISTKYYYREDISCDIAKVEGVDLKTPGVYYIEYTSSNFLYKSKTLVRTIIVSGVEVDG